MIRRDQQFRDQPSLFDEPTNSRMPVIPGVMTGTDVARLISRKNDPETSKSAAEKMIVSGRREQHAEELLKLVKDHPGRIGEELDAIGGAKNREYSRRAGDLKNARLIEPGRKRKNSRGNDCETLWPFGKVPNEFELMQKTTKPTDMPDAVTCPTTPKDQHGDPISDGNAYIVSARGRRSVKVEVIYDPESGELLHRQWQSRDGWGSVGESDPDAKWELCE